MFLPNRIIGYKHLHQMLSALFSEEGNIPLLINGGSMSRYFGNLDTPVHDQFVGVWKYGVEIPIEIRYQSPESFFKSHTYCSYLSLKIANPRNFRTLRGGPHQ